MSYKEKLLLKFYNFMKKNKFSLLSLSYVEYHNENGKILNKNKNEWIDLTNDEIDLLNQIDRSYISKNELYNFYHIKEKEEHKRKRNVKSSPVTQF